MERKHMGMNDILPPKLIHRILLRVPAEDLLRLRFISKLWHSLISHPDFAESHYNVISAASSHSHFFVLKDNTNAYCVQLDTLFHVPTQKEERSFSEISIPKQLEGCHPINLIVLGGCLALYWNDVDNNKTKIWVMKEYKVPSSWILIYEIPYGMPVCTSNGSDIIALNFTPIYSKIRFGKYNVRGELLNHSPPPLSPYCYFSFSFCVYTESLLPLPGDIKDRDKKKKTGQECFEQHDDVAKD
ncbi:uncharacterized protein LOC107638088 isoform X2 [Arachis ipaensis]|uniref:uncharacterized protein LOC107638088 isoform X2 n=1 Tax=Arachis ipaensis TaxID=130454 RepID=UPI000A2B54F8|nr:uncharacterized protein LOC107638088 isoform X2 [Arachis ipaensis]XP_025649580.1 uncharacterized protein LOC112744236 isoform X2 [Arachis hypogaea]